MNEAAKDTLDNNKSLGKYSTLLVSAIANNKPLILHLKRHTRDVKELPFPDHHYFNDKDYEKMKTSFNDIFSQKKVIIITEKDSVKMDIEKVGEIPVFVLPIKIKFHQHGEDDFITEIKEHVRSYTRSV